MVVFGPLWRFCLALGCSAVCKCFSLHPVSLARRRPFKSRNTNWAIARRTMNMMNAGMSVGTPTALRTAMILLKQKKENVKSREWTNELKVVIKDRCDGNMGQHINSRELLYKSLNPHRCRLYYVRRLEDHNFDEAAGFFGRCSIWPPPVSGQTSSRTSCRCLSKPRSSDCNERPSFLCSADITSRCGRTLEHSPKICSSNSPRLGSDAYKLTLEMFKSCDHLYE